MQALERWRFPATEAGPLGSQEGRGETHTQNQGGDQPTETRSGGEAEDTVGDRQEPGGLVICT
jgi:hypothetical protein